MDQEEFQELLKQNGWTKTKAFRLLHLLTGAAVDVRNITKDLNRTGRVSEPMAASLRLLSEYEELRRENAELRRQSRAV